MENNLQTQELKNSKTNPSYADVLRETQQEEFPLLSDATRGIVEDPLTLMSSIYDEDGVVVPCALPDTMWKHLPQMMSEPLSLYDDADIRTMLLMALMPTLGSAMSNVRVRHVQRLYSLGMMNICAVCTSYLPRLRRRTTTACSMPMERISPTCISPNWRR